MTGRVAELVSPDEAALIGVARALIDGGALPAARSTVPAMISPACARLLGDALAQAWPALWRRGGGTAPAIGHDGARGRVWERHPPTGLAFSAVSFELVRWLAAGGGGGTRVPGAATLGDHVVVYLALATTRGAAIHARLADHPVVRGAPLAWLGFADSLARAGGGAPPTTGFDDLCTGAGAIVVESIAGELAARWRAAELGKRAIRDPHALIALGAAQHRVLDAWLAACDRHARRDLAGFVIDAAQPLLARGVAPAPDALDPATPLAVRADARRAAGGLLYGVMRWAAWDAEHRGVRFLDDDYAVAQRLLARFEPIGAAGADRAQAWLADLAALAPAAKLDPP